MFPIVSLHVCLCVCLSDGSVVFAGFSAEALKSRILDGMPVRFLPSPLQIHLPLSFVLRKPVYEIVVYLVGV